MKHHDFTGIIPEQITGEEIETDASVQLTNEKEASSHYQLAKQKLLHVNNWHHVAGLVSANFQLVNANGEEVDRVVQKGDFFKIDIPGPGSSEGDGFDWVMVEEVKEVNQEHIESIGLRVKPCSNPLGAQNETAHFYSDDATSSFIVMREGETVAAWIIDRNVKPNKTAGTVTDKIRDVAVGIGAIGLFSKIQWKGLAKGLVEKSNK